MSDGCGCGNGACTGCCEGIHVVTPVAIHNRPGLEALAYRVGTYGRFLASMLARLSSAEHPALAELRTRDRGDASIALLDAWATVADVLAFYQERIANEGFLRTATERRSVLELARLIGYTPRPGLAASVYLAFTVEAGNQLVIPSGTRAQSVPLAKELPQTFETSEPLTATGTLSALPVRRTRAQLLLPAKAGELKELVVAGTAAAGQLRPGDVLRATSAAFPGVVLFGATAATADPVLGSTRVVIAIHPLTPVSTPTPTPTPIPGPSGQEGISVASASATKKTKVGQLVDVLRKPASVPPRAARDLHRNVSSIYSTQSAAVTGLLEILVPAVKGLLTPALAHTAELAPTDLSFERMKVKAALFGHQAQAVARYEEGTVKGFTDAMTLATDGGGGTPGHFHPPNYVPSRELFLDAVYDGVTPGTSIVLVNPALDPDVTSRVVTDAATVSAAAFGVSGRVTKLTLDAAWPDHEATLSTVLRGAQVFADPAPLDLAERSIDDEDVQGDVLELAGLQPHLEPGRFVVVSGERSDVDLGAVQLPRSGEVAASTGTGVPGVELAMIASVEQRATRLPDGAALPGDTVHTFLTLAQPLAYRYLRPTVVVNANVVAATHGATSHEVLGAGDATKPLQAFRLKQPPLTYLPAPTAVGARRALEVRVNDVLWHEADDLLAAGSEDRRFVVRTDDDGTSSVVFGDGQRGARLPTGVENVRAVYRTGLGRAGNVGAGRISIAVDRPLGVKEVVNPLAATGGADRESRDQARRNAPVAVQALDRLVSVQDYADFARSFAGIGAASATELSDGRRQLIHVTIAGVDDAAIAASSDLYHNLLTALIDLGDPFEPVELSIRRLRALVVQAGVAVQPDYGWDTVEPAVRAALLTRFGPDRRQLGQDVVQADVLATVQAVPGVTYVRLLVLDAVGEAELVMPNPAAGLRLRPRVVARPARRAKGTGFAGGPDRIDPAELVVLSPATPDTLILSELP